MRLLDDQALRERGIKHSRQHRQRLIKAGKFPAPIKIGLNTNAWIEHEIDAYIESRIAVRDTIQQLTSEKKKARTG